MEILITKGYIYFSFKGTLELIGPGYSAERQIPLHTVFLNPHIFYEKGFDLLLRGLVRERAQSVDSYITDEVSYILYIIY